MPATFTEAVPVYPLVHLLSRLGYDARERRLMVAHAREVNTFEGCPIFRLEAHREAAESLLAPDPEWERYGDTGDEERWTLTPLALSLHSEAAR